MTRSAHWFALLALGAGGALAQDTPTARGTPSARAPSIADSITGTGGRRLSPGAELAAAGYIAAKGGLEAHRKAIAETGVGLYYGDKSPYFRLDAAGRRAWLEAHKKPGTELVAMPRESSCIGWALECVGKAYARVGRASTWTPIRRRVTAQGARGTVLAKELIADGWVGVYWNPDTRTPNDDQQEHPFTARIARTKKRYYDLPVPHAVIDYRPTEGSPTTLDRTGLAKLAKVPFWFGVARGGKHTFVGYGTTISEFHWDRDPDSESAIEEVPLTRFAWNSGMLVVPPGTWR